jgi:hypothetical protein
MPHPPVSFNALEVVHDGDAEASNGVQYGEDANVEGEGAEQRLCSRGSV